MANLFGEKIFILLSVYLILMFVFLATSVFHIGLFDVLYSVMTFLFYFITDICLFLLPFTLICLYTIVFLRLFKIDIVSKRSWLVAVLLFMIVNAIISIHIQNISETSLIIMPDKTIYKLPLAIVCLLNGVVLYFVEITKYIRIYNVYYVVIPIALLLSLVRFL